MARRRSRAENPFVRSIRVVVEAARRGRFRVALIGGFALPFHGVQRATGDVDFLADAGGAERLHDALVAAGAECIHRSADAANYISRRPDLAPIDFVFAHRERAVDMLRRAPARSLARARLRVPVVDAEGIVGLKLQALVNAPSRRARDEADIEAVIAAQQGALDIARLRDYFRVFDREADLERLLAAVKGR